MRWWLLQPTVKNFISHGVLVQWLRCNRAQAWLPILQNRVPSRWVRQALSSLRENSSHPLASLAVTGYEPDDKCYYTPVLFFKSNRTYSLDNLYGVLVIYHVVTDYFHFSEGDICSIFNFFSHMKPFFVYSMSWRTLKPTASGHLPLSHEIYALNLRTIRSSTICIVMLLLNLHPLYY